MSTLVLEVPEDTFASLPFERADFGQRTLLAACVKWVESGRLSQSRAAEICGVTREAFLSEMSSYQVSPFQESGDEMKDVLWTDFPLDGDALPVPQWHQEILDEREGQIAAGTASFTDWEAAKREILAKVK